MQNGSWQQMRLPIPAMMVSYLLLLSTLFSAPEPRIVGGGNATNGEWPWMAALLNSYTPDNYQAQMCGGSLIHPSWILTAAHCVEGASAYDIEVAVNFTDLYDQKIKRYEVQEIIIHPGYNSTNYQNDIALLRLATPITHVAPIPLIDHIAFEAPSLTAYILGWGLLSEGGRAPSQLQEAQVEIFTLEYANHPFRYDGALKQDMIPAGTRDGKRDTCQGDSGGPLVVASPYSPTDWVLVGVTSWGEGCAEALKPGIYARVSYFRHWILQKITPEYAAWELSQLLMGEYRDPDGDGLPNLAEFAYGTNPRIADSLNTYLSLAITPPLLQLATPLPQEEVRLQLQSSADLRNWSSPFDMLESSLNGIRSFTYETSLYSQSKQFYRPHFAFAPSRYIPPASLTISPNQVRNGSLSITDSPDPTYPDYYADNYSLTGVVPGQQVCITMSSSQVDAYLILFDWNTGVVLFEDDDSGSGLDSQICLTIEAGKTYGIRASSADTYETGSYRLIVE